MNQVYNGTIIINVVIKNCICILYIASCSDGQLRLVYGYHGPVKICSNQRWETLKNYRWTPFMARLACIELGFLGTYDIVYYNYYSIIIAYKACISRNHH